MVVITFNINREYIANKLCENRDQPKLNCKGKCVMMKKMKQEEKKEQEGAGINKIEINSLTLSSKSFFATDVAPVYISNKPYFLPGNTGKPIDRSGDFFRPPTA
jgi:hypothetical protein